MSPEEEVPMNDQIAIPCVVMRGGTSRGPFFLASDLPADPRLRDALLLSVMGGWARSRNRWYRRRQRRRQQGSDRRAGIGARRRCGLSVRPGAHPRRDRRYLAELREHAGGGRALRD